MKYVVSFPFLPRALDFSEPKLLWHSMHRSRRIWILHVSITGGDRGLLLGQIHSLFDYV
jgi:hypothetical protein